MSSGRKSTNEEKYAALKENAEKEKYAALKENLTSPLAKRFWESHFNKQYSDPSTEKHSPGLVLIRGMQQVMRDSANTHAAMVEIKSLATRWVAAHPQANNQTVNGNSLAKFVNIILDENQKLDANFCQVQRKERIDTLKEHVKVLKEQVNALKATRENSNEVSPKSYSTDEQKNLSNTDKKVIQEKVIGLINKFNDDIAPKENGEVNISDISRAYEDFKDKFKLACKTETDCNVAIQLLNAKIYSNENNEDAVVQLKRFKQYITNYREKITIPTDIGFESPKMK